MRNAYTVEAIRRAEADLRARLPDGTLMQRAAAGLAAVVLRLLQESRGVYGARVVLLVGVGDNGGDALYAGALLQRRGVSVRAVLVDPARAHHDGLQALLAAGGRAMAAVADVAGNVDNIGDHDALPPAPDLSAADLILDGLTGIGGKGGLRGAAAVLAAAAADSGAPVVAVDLPSGIDADTGEVTGPAVNAAVTVVFGGYKPGLFLEPGAGHAGVLEFVDIGLAPHLTAEPAAESLQRADLAALLPVPGRDVDKYRRGVVGVACGSAKYPGAGLLAVGGALHSGVGAVRYLGPADVTAVHPEVMLGEGRVQAWVAGCGLDRDAPGSAEILDRLLALTDVPLLIDAEGLALLDQARLARVGERRAPTVLTPHAGEAAALLGRDRAGIEARPLAAVHDLVGRTGATVLLKGPTTVIAGPGRSPVRVNPTGTAALATAGSGDVLAGLCGGLLAAGLDPVDAASAGAYLHGLAGRIAARRGPVSAGDLIPSLRAAWHNSAQ
ncbi:MAG TPA: NAD(P)H-hydrate dehydratase [Actinocrinis sp.]|nr:NAD(P)H-hydrate dehydratase [Actinocrinis sp.]